ncbi:MAG: type II CAAX prenyl endopeptidase Rce1 family protein [Gemmatimonadota bacterium]
MSFAEDVRPSRGELIAVVLAGGLHVGTEILFTEPHALWLSAVVSIAFLGYLVWRGRTPGMLRAWGMRADNFRVAIGPHLTFAVVGGLTTVGVGAALGTLSFPPTFWITLALYPIWGTAQQFALQNLLARNVYGFTSNTFVVALIAAGLFAASHYPRLELVALTAAAGIPFTLLFRRYPNLWAVGIAHGILGSLAVYSVLREDPGAAILGFFTGVFGG